MSRIVVVTHDGRHHADELLAVWFFHILHEGEITVVRSSDPEVWKAADVLLDCGGVYDPTSGRFDHHGEAEVPKAPALRICPYATAGLVWKHYGTQIIETILKYSEEGPWPAFAANTLDLELQQAYTMFAHMLDCELVAPLDAWDNGVYPSPEITRRVLPVQWILPHLDFETAMMAMGRALTYRLRAMAEAVAAETQLERELWSNGPTDFWLWGEWLVVKAPAGQRLDVKAAKSFACRIVGQPLLAVVSSIRYGTKWGAFFTGPLPSSVRIPEEFEYASGRRAVFHVDAERLLAFLKDCALRNALPLPKIRVN